VCGIRFELAPKSRRDENADENAARSQGGEIEPKCLTRKANYRGQLQDIPWHSLPLTFRDVITFIRTLGYEYIWIDSLCIVQDDDNDWRREAKCMGAYYGGAALTIASTGGNDCNSGLFSHAPVSSFHIKLDGHVKGTISARTIISHGLQAVWNNIQSENLPALRRGWIFQERLLSRRVLHFTQRELQWECGESTMCACGFINKEPTDPKISYARFLRSTGSDNLKGSKMLLHSWFRTVEEYSQLHLTYADDKFPAISSLAIQFSQKLGARYSYCSGLWYSVNPWKEICLSMAYFGEKRAVEL
jgi:hypothetical protein